MDRSADEARARFGEEDTERRRRSDQRRDREREWREWGSDRSAARSPEPEWSPREREWRDYDRDRDWDPYARNLRASDWDRRRGYGGPSGERYWSPYEMEPESDRYRTASPGRQAGRTGGLRGRGPKGYQRSDERIYEDICERLTYADVDAANIEVKVAGGEVTLSGTVADRRDKRHAEYIAEEVSGVRDVHNNLRVFISDDTLT